jgi:glycosyltransferase involved in cell wall biosynthesis
MDYFGVPDKAVYTGLYAADGEVFAAGPPLASRGRDFVFVGQFIERKGVRDLIRAVERLRAEGYACELLAIGEGGLLNALSKAGVATLGFSAPETIAQELQRSRFLVLPSLEDHWGVVVHEATLSGCGLVLATGVGSRHDLLSIENGFLSVSGNADSLYAAMKAALGVDESWMDRCWRVSTDLAAEFSPRKWAATVWGIVASLEAVGAAPEPPTTPSPRTSERGDRGTNHEGVRSLSEDATR